MEGLGLDKSRYSTSVISLGKAFSSDPEKEGRERHDLEAILLNNGNNRSKRWKFEENNHV